MEFTGSSAWNRNLLSPDAAPAAAAVSNPLAAPISTLALRTRAATSLLFIEANVTDYQSLVAGVKAGNRCIYSTRSQMQSPKLPKLL